MTNRPIVVYLLVGLLLGCPFLCLSDSGRSEQAEGERAGTRASCCGCCSGESGDDAPGHDDSNCEETDCLCRGAIVGVPVEMVGRDVRGVAVTTIEGPAAVACRASAASRTAAAPSSHFPPLSSGREICALLGVLLL